MAIKDMNIGMSIDGARKKEDIVDYVVARMPELKGIYEEYLKQKPNFSGKVVLKFTITSSGNITNVSIVSSTTSYPAFDSAVKGHIATWNCKEGAITPLKDANTTVTILLKFPFVLDENSLSGQSDKSDYIKIIQDMESTIKLYMMYINMKRINRMEDFIKVLDIYCSDEYYKRSELEIEDFLRRKVLFLQSIYEGHYGRKPNFSGKITLKFSIVPTGNVNNVSIESSTTGYPELDSAIKYEAITWRGKPIPQKDKITPVGGNTTVTVLLDFTN
ncbi:MAG: TonB family protein [Fibromonadaceae bacterium]|jgi:TonB family protein|nr:TonB family protein [Fibromonadaceae bacterium]